MSRMRQTAQQTAGYQLPQAPKSGKKKTKKKAKGK
tara:strand:+ start:1196 stop:1300 length:105 start_codon:yes stop_codon:yes gene_type:complete